MNEKKGSNTIFLMVAITQEQGAWSLCKIYLRLGAIHAYIAHSHHSTLLPKWLQILPIFYISKPKYIHFTHISHQVNSLFFFFIYMINQLRTWHSFSFPIMIFHSFFFFLLWGILIDTLKSFSSFIFSVPIGFLFLLTFFDLFLFSQTQDITT